MLKGLGDIVTIAWGRHMSDQLLFRILAYISLIVFTADVLTTTLAFVFLGISATEAVTLIVLSSGSMALCAHFGKDYLVSLIFNDWPESKQATRTSISEIQKGK